MFAKLKAIILTQDRKQQLRIMRSLMAAYVFVACIGLMFLSMQIGYMDAFHTKTLSLIIASNVIFWYAVLRSGLNLRFQDPALTLLQVLSALTIVAGAYASSGRLHGGVIALLALTQVFGIFNMQRRDTVIASAYTLVLMGGVMAYKIQSDPENYPFWMEIGHFLLLAAILPTIASLAAQLSQMRARLQSQKNELAHALTRIQILATRDELTGLFNRRHMREVLSQHQKRLNRSGRHRFCLALVDIDHFKHINDSLGHKVGDEVLKTIAQHLQNSLRETDVMARWGGEEFLILLNDTQTEAAIVGLERARTDLAERVLLPDYPDLRVTFSAGLTGYLDIESLDVCIERADRALYQAKRQGRNQTVVDATTQ